jgi:aromatic-L-amino-acid/L-tryptophan decarboxylase
MSSNWVHPRPGVPSQAPKHGAVAEGQSLPAESSLDPKDWAGARALAHQALDEALDFLQSVRERPVWQPVPPALKQQLAEPLPVKGQGMEATYEQFLQEVLPYATGNIHPRFFGYVHGTGTVSGVLAEMLAATMNSNCGGRDHGAVYVERCVIDWCKQMFGYPEAASGILVSGTSMGTFVALTVARNAKAGWDVRQDGLNGQGKKLVMYASTEGHESIVKAAEVLGIGRAGIRRIPVDDHFRMNLAELERAVAADRAAGLQPFCVVGTVGTVNTAAIDDLSSLAQIARRERLWLHVDGAFGGMTVLSEELRPRLKGIEQADSIAFDFHKWLHVPYDCGCVLVRDGEQHWRTFTSRPDYLEGAEAGLMGGGRWFCEYGPELSRGFRALKVWFTLKTYGARALGDAILQNCRQAQYLAGLIRQEPELELLAEPSLNIVCFRYRPQGVADQELNNLNEQLVVTLQERGIAAPSTTKIRGRESIRVNLTNHRSRREDLALLVTAVLQVGRELTPVPPR